jgi:hypothetical protein
MQLALERLLNGPVQHGGANITSGAIKGKCRTTSSFYKSLTSSGIASRNITAGPNLMRHQNHG